MSPHTVSPHERRICQTPRPAGLFADITEFQTDLPAAALDKFSAHVVTQHGGAFLRRKTIRENNLFLPGTRR